jgi:hypothetical protein
MPSSTIFGTDCAAELTSELTTELTTELTIDRSALDPHQSDSQPEFDRAIASDYQRYQTALRTYLVDRNLGHLLNQPIPAPTSSTLRAMVQLSQIMRSKMQPKQAYKSAIPALYESHRLDRPVGLVGCLASPTAHREVAAYWQAARSLGDQGFAVDLQVTLFRWDYIADVVAAKSCYGAEAEAQLSGQFWEGAERLERAWCEAGWGRDRLNIVEVAVDDQANLLVCDDPEVRRIHEAVCQIQADRPSAPLTDHVTWLEQFYRQRESLAAHSEAQVRLDLVLRMAAGQRADRLAQSQDWGTALMLTIEKDARLCRSYQTELPMLNLDPGRLDPGRLAMV